MLFAAGLQCAEGEHRELSRRAEVEQVYLEMVQCWVACSEYSMTVPLNLRLADPDDAGDEEHIVTGLGAAEYTVCFRTSLRQASASQAGSLRLPSLAEEAEEVCSYTSG